MTENPTVAVVIPAYQAAATVGDVVARSLRQVALVVVVDDGSDDGTAAAARAAGASQVLVHEVNRGKGAAMRTAMTKLFAEGVEYVATLDADGQHLPEQLPVLLDLLPQEPDLVLGVRSHHFAAMGRLRRLSNRISSRLISMMAGQSVSDIQTGFRMYSRKLAAQISLPEDRFEAESAVVVRACRRGLKVVCVPVEMGVVDGRGTSHYAALTDSLRIAKAVIGARFERSSGSSPR